MAKKIAPLKLSIVNVSRRAVPAAFLRKWCARMATEVAREVGARYQGGELTVAFLTEPEARALNLEFRKRDYATDVLSFSTDEEGQVGELAICPKVISRQAKEHGLLVREELGYMLLHGFLHLLGFDHEASKKKEKEMMDLQDRIFERLLGKSAR